MEDWSIRFINQFHESEPVGVINNRHFYVREDENLILLYLIRMSIFSWFGNFFSFSWSFTHRECQFQLFSVCYFFVFNNKRKKMDQRSLKLHRSHDEVLALVLILTWDGYYDPDKSLLNTYTNWILYHLKPVFLHAKWWGSAEERFSIFTPGEEESVLLIGGGWESVIGGRQTYSWTYLFSFKKINPGYWLRQKFQFLLTERWKFSQDRFSSLRKKDSF